VVRGGMVVGVVAAGAVMLGGARIEQPVVVPDRAAAQAPAAGADASVETVDQFAARLMDATLTDRARQSAADELVKRADEDGVRATLARALEGPLAGTGGVAECFAAAFLGAFAAAGGGAGGGAATGV